MKLLTNFREAAASILLQASNYVDTKRAQQIRSRLSTEDRRKVNEVIEEIRRKGKALPGEESLKRADRLFELAAHGYSIAKAILARYTTQLKRTPLGGLDLDEVPEIEQLVTICSAACGAAERLREDAGLRMSWAEWEQKQEIAWAPAEAMRTGVAAAVTSCPRCHEVITPDTSRERVKYHLEDKLCDEIQLFKAGEIV